MFRHSHQIFLQWLAIILAVLFGFYVVWDLGMIAILLEYDKSYISSIIAIIFMMTTVAAGLRVAFLSREIDRAEDIVTMLRDSHGDMELRDNSRIFSAGRQLPACLLHEQLYKQLMRRQHSHQAGSSPLMLESMEKDISASHDFGWFMADIMIKLGLLGTVIGFIVMLGSVAVIDNADITTIQNMLVDMSAGMRIALFTTLSGLLAGMLLGLQYYFLDRGARCLMGLIGDTIETYLGE